MNKVHTLQLSMILFLAIMLGVVDYILKTGNISDGKIVMLGLALALPIWLLMLSIKMNGKG